MDKTILSVIIPGIRSYNWGNIFFDLKKELADYEFELICVGPNFPPSELEIFTNFRFIRDFGSPSRCLQIGVLHSIGEYICWIPDDCKLENGGIKSALDFIKNISEKCDGICLRYSEGRGFTGDQHLQETYWIGSTHEDQRLPQVDNGWKIAPLFMYPSDLYFDLGGLDCRFEHVNLNTHDLAYRVQKLGGKIHLSPQKILSVDWIPGQDVITQAHFENDVPLFKELYGGLNFPRLKIEFNNWKNQDYIWKRRFKKK